MLDRRQQTLQQVVAQERQKTRDLVRERFARFGDKPCARILDAAAVPRGIQRVLETLGLPPTAQFEQQLDLLTRFIIEHGPRMFLQRLDALDRKSKSTGHQNYRSDRVEGTDPGLAAAETQAREIRGSAPVAPPSVQTPGQLAASSAAAAETQIKADPTRGVTPPEWFDKYGKYVGPERRCGQERRTGRDRRDRVDAINKNTRFGGDRRKTPRRRDDRTRMYSPQSAMR